MKRFLCRGLSVGLLFVLIAGCATQEMSSETGATHSATPRQQVVATVSPTAASTCSGLYIEVASGVTGSLDPQAAIDAFLHSEGTSLKLPLTGWVRVSAGRYMSSTAVIEMVQTPGGGYVVVGARTC